MTAYTPRLRDFILPALFCGLGVYFTAFYFLAGAVVLFVITIGFVEARADLIYSAARMAEAIKDLDPDRYRALGVVVPYIRNFATKDNGPLQMVENRSLRLATLREILEHSNNFEIMDQRGFAEKETVKRREWLEASRLMIERGYLIENSAVGSHSYLWHTGGLEACWLAYFGEMPFNVEELEDEKILS